MHLILLTRPAGRGAADDPLALPAGALRRAARSIRSPADRGGSAWSRDTRAGVRASVAGRRRAGAASWPARRAARSAPGPRSSRARRCRARRRDRAPWTDVLAAVRGAGRGDASRARGPGRSPRSSCTREGAQAVETEWSERDPARPAPGRDGRARSRRCRLCRCGTPTWRAWRGGPTSSCATRIAWRSCGPIRAVDAAALRGAVELVEDTRVRFALNVSEELACEALAYRLERLLAL